MPRVFLITGTSTGFGYHMVQEVIDKGDIAIATARNPSSLSFENASSKNFLALKLDVTKDSDIEAVFKEAISKFGRVDVVVNNAGYGLSGPFEELTQEQIRTQMEVNFFGLIQVTRKAMEVMREQKPSGGLIQQVTSIGGQRGCVSRSFSLARLVLTNLSVPLFSSYCASKWAVEGFTEAISKEVKPEWNIKFSLIEPGGFRSDIPELSGRTGLLIVYDRTDWAGRSMVFSDKRHSAYDHLDAKKMMGQRNGTQAGDPKKGGKAMYELAVMDDPPLRVVIGTDAYKVNTPTVPSSQKRHC